MQDSPLFNWLVSLYPAWATMTGRDVYLASKLAMAELLLSGCTCSSGAVHHTSAAPHCCHLDSILTLPSKQGWAGTGDAVLPKSFSLPHTAPLPLQCPTHPKPLCNLHLYCDAPWVIPLSLVYFPSALYCRPSLHIPKQCYAGRHHTSCQRDRHSLPPNPRDHDLGEEQGGVATRPRCRGGRQRTGRCQAADRAVPRPQKVTPAEARHSPHWNRQPAVLCGMRGLEDVFRQGCICTALG